MGPVGSYLSQTDLAAGLSVFEAARDRVGNTFELLVEGHSRWDVNMGISDLPGHRTDRGAVGWRIFASRTAPRTWPGWCGRPGSPRR